MKGYVKSPPEIMEDFSEYMVKENERPEIAALIDRMMANNSGKENSTNK
ncbi:MAG: hypothetical protein SFW35_11430 [Chitinophagales bacterium]|nr:hypothetical protein [Chitinophagales bacterium]